jgi:hypothetical protein
MRGKRAAGCGYVAAATRSPAGLPQRSRFTNSASGRRRTGPCLPLGHPTTMWPATIQPSGTPTASRISCSPPYEAQLVRHAPKPWARGGQQKVLHRGKDRPSEQEFRRRRIVLLCEQDGREFARPVM